MNLITYLHTTLESGFALFCIMAAIYIHLYEAVSPKRTAVMTGWLATSAFVDLADTLAFFYRGDTSRVGTIMVRISNFAVFAGMFIMLAFAAELLDRLIEERGSGKDKRLRNAVFVICAIGLVMLLISVFTGILYSFDRDNYYHRGSYYFLMTLTGGVGILFLMIRTLIERRALKRSEFFALMILWMIPAIGAALQMEFYGISISNIASSIVILLILGLFMKEASDEMSVRKSFILNEVSIENISGEIDTFLKKAGIERQNRIRVRFTAEDSLMRFRKHFGDPSMVKVTASMSMGRPYVKMEHEGEAFNPFSKTNSTYDELSTGLLASSGISPVYSYAHDNNVIKITLGRKRINPVVTILISILFGIIIGSVASIALSTQDVEFVIRGFLSPTFDLWNNILYSVAAPAMIIIVMSTTLETREVSEQGGKAGFITGRYFAITLLMGLVTIAAAAAVNSKGFGTEPFTRETSVILLKKLFGIIPHNILDPLREFNTAQLILMGLIFAYAIMAIGQQASGLASIVHQLDLVSTKLVEWITGLMPLFTIALTAQLILEHNAGLLSGLIEIIPFALVLSAICMIVSIFYISRRVGVRTGLLFRKLWPSFALTLRTGQVSDSYALAEQCCKRDLGIQKIFTEKLLPLGLVLYMPVSMIGMISFVIYASYRSHIVMTPMWMLTAIVFALILLVAAPPIPGVNLLSYVVIMGQLGIGREYVIAAMIFDIIFNLFASAANQMMLQADLVLQADRVGLLNHKALNKEIS
ncbi:MAG: cation:dicarboxylase symporter family transporter [Mogibacterium sp.]|nr:cation:dicarboxylase symporter family transporter [Mogibacterium sp.]